MRPVSAISIAGASLRHFKLPPGRAAPALPFVSRFPGVVSIFPVIWHARVAQNKSHQSGETCFGPHIVREDQDAALARLNADHRVGSLSVVATLIEPVPLRPVKKHDAQTSVEVLPLPRRRQVRQKKRKLTRRRDME